MILIQLSLLFLGCEFNSKPNQNFDLDNDGYFTEDDCDDTNPNSYPGAPELCDGVDNDCNTLVDEDDAIGAVEWRPDSDGDGYGDPLLSVIACNAPDGYVLDDSDCDDSLADVFPGADEYCDEIDNDCDGVIDEDSALDSSVFYRDVDADGFGNRFIVTRSCFAEAGYVDNDTDCDDSNPETNPDASEMCDGIDNDCDDLTDDADDSVVDQQNWFIDLDGDGHGSGSVIELCELPMFNAVLLGDDCDDENVAISPSATELCGDGIDNNCDTLIDQDDPNAASVLWFMDADLDGYGDPDNPIGISCESISDAAPNSQDCNDSDPDISPAAAEIFYDGIDQDCLGDDDFDSDLDGHVSELYGGDDCDDSNENIHPDQPDACSDGIDNNCDGHLDVCELNQEWENLQTGLAAGESLLLTDWTGDGQDEWIVSSPTADSISNGGGSVWVYSDLTTDPIHALHGDSINLQFGSAISMGGDLIGVGGDTLIIGAKGADFNGLNAGSVYLTALPGSTELYATDLMLRIDGIASGDRSGTVVSGGYDMTDDGQVDLLISAPFSDLNGADSGAVFVVEGPIEQAMSLNQSAIQLIGGSFGEQAGSALTIGDYNGDGLSDIAIGSPMHAVNQYAGRVSIVYAPYDDIVLLDQADGRFDGVESNGRSGSALVSGDMNADGLIDLAVGAPHDNGGSVYLLTDLSQVTSLANAPAMLTSPTSNARFGAELSLSDVNADGHVELIIGAPDDDQGGLFAGAAYVFSPSMGGAGMAMGWHIPDAVLLGNEPTGQLGTSLAPVDDGVWIGGPGLYNGAGGMQFLMMY